MNRTLLLISAAFVLTACGPEGGEEAQDMSAITHSADEHEHLVVPVEYRLAFMSGHVEAGLALYRAGAPDQAARHLLHPVSESYAEERAGLDALGFDPAPFEQVSAALEAGQPASEIEPLLEQAEANLRAVRTQAGGDTIAIIRYLMDVLAEEYAAGVTDGVITTPGEYQDAFGFAVVAHTMATELGNEGLAAELANLIALWPTAPLADTQPTLLEDILVQIDQVRVYL